MRVGYELTSLELDAEGTARAASGLRRALEDVEEVEIVPLAHPGARTRLGRHRVVRGLTRELGWFPLGLPFRVRRLGVDLLHCPAHLVPPYAPVPLVVTVNDTLALDHPEWLTRANVLQHRLVLGRALGRSARVLVPSRFTRDRVATAYDLAPERIDVVPWGLDSRFRPGPPPHSILERLGITEPYLLTVGRLQPRKNIESVLASYESLVRDGIPHSLVIVGGRGWHDSELVSRLQSSPCADRVVATGRVDDDDLVALYRGAACFIFPSRYEGFGFPPLEAMACETPVVCSNRASLPEVAEGAALLVDPDDAGEVAEAIREALQPTRAEALVAAGRTRAREFTWERCAELTVAAYREAVA